MLKLRKRLKQVIPMNIITTSTKREMKDVESMGRIYSLHVVTAEKNIELSIDNVV